MKPKWLRWEPFTHYEGGYSEMVEHRAMQAYLAPAPIREWPVRAPVYMGCYEPEELFLGVVVSGGWYPDTYAVLIEASFWRWLYPHSELSKIVSPTIHPWVPASNLSVRDVLVTGLDRLPLFG